METGDFYMRLATGQFNESFAPITDGVANVVKNYALWLNRKYGNCSVVTPDYPGYKDNEKFDVLRYQSLPFPLKHPYRAGTPFLDVPFQRTLKSQKFDLIHAHSPFSSGKLALKLARDKGIPIVATFHSKYYDDFKSVVKSDILSRMLLKSVMEFYNSVDYVWTVNKSTVDTLREYGFKGRVEVVENGIDFNVNHDNINLGFRQDKSNNYHDNQKTMEFLYVGQQVWHKNLKLLVNSLRFVKDSGIKFKMTMVGEGNSLSGIKQLVQTLGMDEDFVFTGRINNREKLKAIYTRADIFIFPSVYDTFSLVVREAAAVACPSIVIKGSSAAENIKDSYNGFLAENNEIQFARTIKEVASDPNKLKQVGINASNTLLRSWESVVDEVSGRYTEIIKTFK
jgi:1,2-diacylglycerol 3-alpha-glucosyltransferase